MRTKYGIRVQREDEEAVWTELRPGLSYVDLEIAQIYELFPLPHGTQRQTMVQLLKDWAWNARPLQPGRSTFSHMSWKVGAAGPPTHMVMQGFDLEIVVTPIKDLTPQKFVPKVIASQKTQKHLMTTPSTKATSSSDPWMTSPDPWMNFQPTAQSSGNAGKTRLAEIKDQLCSDVTAKVRKELETHVGQMEVDSDKQTNDQTEARFQALEVGMQELKQHNTQFLQWFHEAGDRMKQTEKAVNDVQTTLGQHQLEIQQLGGIVKTTVTSLKEDMAREFSSGFAHIEALLDKRQRTE